MTLNSLVQTDPYVQIGRLEPALNKSLLSDIDVAKTKITDAVRLDRVGMSQIECPVLISQPNGVVERVPARIDAFVSLDEPQKGIHMSRLFLAVERHLSSTPLSPKLLRDITREFLDSHEGVSQSAHVRVNFDYMIRRPSLLSQNSGWRSYPVSLWASLSSEERTGADLTVKYSSTCPCSAALARQLIQKQFDKDFVNQNSIDAAAVRAWLGTERAIAGTPHGQRSDGRVKTELATLHSNLQFLMKTIEALEAALWTPVQTAVKREDEQEFARLNASNLMFAEDAVRSMHKGLTELHLFTGTLVEAWHLESLHPHDAVAKVSSGTLSQLYPGF